MSGPLFPNYPHKTSPDHKLRGTYDTNKTPLFKQPVAVPIFEKKEQKGDGEE